MRLWLRQHKQHVLLPSLTDNVKSTSQPTTSRALHNLNCSFPHKPDCIFIPAPRALAFSLGTSKAATTETLQSQKGFHELTFFEPQIHFQNWRKENQVQIPPPDGDAHEAKRSTRSMTPTPRSIEPLTPFQSRLHLHNPSRRAPNGPAHTIMTFKTRIHAITIPCVLYARPKKCI
jgi:hypothetical protein